MSVEGLGFGVHGESRPEGERGGIEVHFICHGEVINHAIDGLQGAVILFHHIANILHAGVFAYAMADVAGVAEGTGEVAFEDVGIEVPRGSTADSLDEVAEVIAAALEFLDQLVVINVGLNGALAANGNPT